MMKLIIRLTDNSIFIQPVYNGRQSMNVDFPEEEIKPGESFYSLTYEDLRNLGSGIHKLKVKQ